MTVTSRNAFATQTNASGIITDTLGPYDSILVP